MMLSEVERRKMARCVGSSAPWVLRGYSTCSRPASPRPGPATGKATRRFIRDRAIARVPYS